MSISKDWLLAHYMQTGVGGATTQHPRKVQLKNVRKEEGPLKLPGHRQVSRFL